MTEVEFKEKYLKYKKKYMELKQQYKTKYIDVVYENKPCGNVLERLFTDKIKCTKDEYCMCGECKQKKLQDQDCIHDKECVSKNCDYDVKTKTGKCSSKTSLLKQLFSFD
jgi:hypothetical protein